MPDLFDGPGYGPYGDYTPAKELSRSEDPDTSKQAAEEIVLDGTQARMMVLALDTLRANPRLTSKELEAKAGGSDGSIRKRLNDLRKMGYATNGPERVCTISGRMAQTWLPVGSTVITAGEPEGWAEFWAAYPRHTARKDALKAFGRLKPSRERLDALLAILAQQKATWKDKAFIPHAATWLNGARWEDEMIEGKCEGTPLAKTMAEKMRGLPSD